MDIVDTEPDALEPTSAVLKRRPVPWRLLTVSDAELSRLEVINRVLDRRLSQVAAARLLGLTDRQVRRLMRRVEARGADGVVSRRRGRPSNNRLPRRFVDQIVALVRAHYLDFGPAFAAEQLAKRHDVRVSRTSLRRMMIAADIWTPRAERRKPIQQPRLRRACYGELIQVDGSDHHWFEDRGPACTLIVYIDDATSRLQVLRFVPSESTFSYMEATKAYLRAYGKPFAFYSDKHTVFRVNKPGATQGDGMTQFGRAMNTLGITILCANSPSAKGRVERANSTLQDRLVKELRLERISTMEAGNAFLEAFRADHNARFSIEPRSPHDVHRPLLATEDLDRIITWSELRSVSQQLTLQYDKVLYLIEPTRDNQKLAGKRVMVVDFPDGRIQLEYEGRILRYREFDKLIQVHQGEVTDNKRLGAMLEFVKAEQAKLPREKRSVKCPTRTYPKPSERT